MVLDPRKSGRVWVEPAVRRVLAGRGGMGRPPRRFLRANGLFECCRPQEVPHSDLQSCCSTAATPSTHKEACMTMSVRRRRATLSHCTRHIRVASPPMASRTPIWYGRGHRGGRGGMASSLTLSFFAQWGGMIQHAKRVQHHTLPGKNPEPCRRTREIHARRSERGREAVAPAAHDRSRPSSDPESGPGTAAKTCQAPTG